MKGDDPSDFMTLAMKFGALTILIRMDEIILGEFFNKIGQLEEFDTLKFMDEEKKIIHISK